MGDQGKQARIQEDGEQMSLTAPGELESRLLPLLDNDGLTKPGKRSGEGLASILPYLVKALKARPKAALPREGGSDSPRRPRQP
jgi:hypothetical protein